MSRKIDRVKSTIIYKGEEAPLESAAGHGLIAKYITDVVQNARKRGEAQMAEQAKLIQLTDAERLELAGELVKTIHQRDLAQAEFNAVKDGFKDRLKALDKEITRLCAELS